jgi:GTP-binding protein
LFRRYGVKREELDYCQAGDIVTISGINAYVTNTVCSPSVTRPLPSTPLDPPTLSLIFSANDSPLQGLSGTKLTSSQIKDRLLREVENNVTITVFPCPGDKIEVRGRGELQLGILIEQMRREGFELTISSPMVLTRKNEKGIIEEPVEALTIDVSQKYTGFIIQALQTRGAELKDMYNSGNESSRLEFIATTRDLLGFRSEAKVATGGEAIINSTFLEFRPLAAQEAPKHKSNKGKLYACCDGRATAHAIQDLEARGEFFIRPGDLVYKGMLVGECNRAQDMHINVAKTKKLTNMRSTSSEEAVRTIPPRLFSLEDSISYIACHSELQIEVTPDKIRLRKKQL